MELPEARRVKDRGACNKPGESPPQIQVPTHFQCPGPSLLSPMTVNLQVVSGCRDWPARKKKDLGAREYRDSQNCHQPWAASLGPCSSQASGNSFCTTTPKQRYFLKLSVMAHCFPPLPVSVPPYPATTSHLMSVILPHQVKKKS